MEPEDYSPDELTAAFAAYEVARYQRMQFERGSDYSPLALTDAEPGVDSLTPDDDALALTVSAEKRRSWRIGQGLRIAGTGHTRSQTQSIWAPPKPFYRHGKYAGHPASVVKTHVNKAAARLGLPGLDDD